MDTLRKHYHLYQLLKYKSSPIYIDRGFIASSHMISLHDMFSVPNSIVSYLDYIAEQNERVKKNHQRKTSPECSIEDFTVKNINMKISSDITSIDRYKGIKQKLQNVDAYKAFAINELINAKNWCSFMNIVKDLVEQGLPFQLRDFYMKFFILNCHQKNLTKLFIFFGKKIALMIKYLTTLND